VPSFENTPPKLRNISETKNKKEEKITRRDKKSSFQGQKGITTTDMAAKNVSPKWWSYFLTKTKMNQSQETGTLSAPQQALYRNLL